MPTLKSLSCQLQWADTNTPFQEYGTCYGDGLVETYIVVPDKPQPFNIRVTSKGFIYEGLAVAVFMDGTYQCNRNRVNLLPAKKGIPRERTEIDFVLRQKEKTIGDGTYMGRQWRFDDHNIVPDPPKKSEEDHFSQLGLIEIIVLRCRATDSDDTNASTVSSAAESHILETAIGEGEGSPEEDDRKSIQDDNTAKGSEPEPAAADDVASIGGMFGIFDGAADYPHPPPGHWPSRPPAQPSYGNQHWYYDDYAYQHGPSYHDNGHPMQVPYSHPPPPGGPRRKHVHFDHGPLHHNARPPPPPPPPPPPGWDDRYSDRTANHWQESHPYPPPQTSTPGLSEWPHAYHNDHGAQNSYGPPHFPHGPPETGSSSSRGPPDSAGRSQWFSTPPTTSYAHHGPLNGAPKIQPPQYSPYLAKFPPQAAPPFPPYPPYGYQPYATSYVPGPPNAWPSGANNAPGNQTAHPFVGGRQPSSSSGISPKSHPQGPKPGSLDPAKEENNPGDNWGQSGSGGTNDWQNQNSGNGNNNPNDEWSQPNGGSNNDNWDNQGKNGNNGEQTSGNDNGNGNWDSQGSGDNDQSWGQQKGGDNNDSGDQEKPWGDSNQNGGWDQSGPNTNQQSGGDPGWGDTNNPPQNAATAAAPATNDCDSQPAAGIQAASVTSPGARPLYGPHGAYYAMQAVAAADVPCDAEEEPRYDVPQSFAQETGSKKQVQPGKGYLYTKKRCSPDYVDRMKEPYARFVFQYRTREELKKDLNIELDVEPSGNEEVQKFQNVPKDELIQMLLRAQGALGGKIPSPALEATDPGSKAVEASEPVAIEPPDISHLNFALPAQRSAVGVGGDKPDDDGWTNTPAPTATPGAWQDTIKGTNPGEQRQDEWGGTNTTPAANNNAGNDEWANTAPDQSTNNSPWGNSNHADSSQAPQNPAGNGANGSSAEAWDTENSKNNVSGDWNGGKGNNESGWDDNQNDTNGAAGNWNQDIDASGGRDSNNNNNGSGGWDNANAMNGQNNVGSWDGANITPQKPTSNDFSRGLPAAGLIADPNQESSQQSSEARVQQPQPAGTNYGRWVLDGRGGWLWQWYAFPVPKAPVPFGYGHPAAYYGPSQGYPQPQYPSTQPAPQTTQAPDQNAGQTFNQPSPARNTGSASGGGSSNNSNQGQAPHNLPPNGQSRAPPGKDQGGSPQSGPSRSNANLQRQARPNEAPNKHNQQQRGGRSGNAQPNQASNSSGPGPNNGQKQAQEAPAPKRGW